MRQFTFGYALWIFVLAATAGSFAAWAGDAALISAIEGRKLCTASFENATWTPMLGETIPEKTGLDVGEGTTVGLVHFGTNSEVTLPAGARVTVLMTGVEGLASDASQAKLEEMPQGLDLEARHQQQVGAINMAHMAQKAPSRMPSVKSAQSESEYTESAMAQAAAPAPPPPPAPQTRPMPSGGAATPQESSLEEMARRAETFENKQAGFKDDEPPLVSEAGDSLNTKGMNVSRSRELFDGGSIGQTTGPVVKSEDEAADRDLLAAFPLDAVEGKIGEIGVIKPAQRIQGISHTDTRRIPVWDHQTNATTTWLLVSTTFPTDHPEMDLIMGGKETSVTIHLVAHPEAAAISVSSAIRLEFRGLPAQAAGVWLSLLERKRVTPEIAAAHLRRLAGSIASGLR